MAELIQQYAVGTAVVLASLAVFFGIGLAVADRFFRVQVDPRQARIEEILPRANCGSCGYGGCAAYAEALAHGEAPPNACTPGGPATAKKIAEILGIQVSDFVPKVAVVKCQGGRPYSGTRFRYVGEPDCRAAAATQYGQTACTYGCLGLGTCVRACPFDAMVLDAASGLPRVLADRCTACGTCAAVCPKNIIEILPRGQYVHVLCRNQEPGRVVRQVCQVGCIACKACEKACPVEGKAVHVTGHLAAVDAEACINCGKCVRACPVNCIGDFRQARPKTGAGKPAAAEVA